MSEELTNRDVQLKILNTIDYLLNKTVKDVPTSNNAFRVLSTEELLNLSKTVETLSIVYNNLHLNIIGKEII